MNILKMGSCWSYSLQVSHVNHQIDDQIIWAISCHYDVKIHATRHQSDYNHLFWTYMLNGDRQSVVHAYDELVNYIDYFEMTHKRFT